MQRFGIKPVRGSSTRGAVGALIQMIRLIRAGKILGITPDGPRGPAREVQPGIIHLAKKTGCPIIPLSNEALRKKVFASWDEFILPYPFNRIVCSVGEPLYLDKEEEDSCSAIKVKKALDENTNQGTLSLYEKGKEKE